MVEIWAMVIWMPHADYSPQVECSNKIVRREECVRKPEYRAVIDRYASSLLACCAIRLPEI
jgi:hypothetical protein